MKLTALPMTSLETGFSGNSGTHLPISPTVASSPSPSYFFMGKTMPVELAGSGSKVLVLTQAHMNPNRALWGQHKEVQAGPTCRVTEVSVKRKPGLKSQYRTQDEAELLWWEGRRCLPPPSLILPRSPEIPVWNPRFPGT